MGRYLSGHHARVDDAHIGAIVQPQTAIHNTAEVASHHRARRDGVGDGVEVVPDPAAPVRVRAGVGVVRHAAEPRARLARREVGEGRGAEEAADEARHGNLGEHVPLDAEWVDVDIRVGEGVVVADLDGATAEGQQGPGVYTYRIRIACVVEELGDRG